MTTTQQNHHTFLAAFGEMGAAMDQHDLDGLMACYADSLVVWENGRQMDKEGLKDYVLELWAGESGFSVEVMATHTIDDVLSAVLEASVQVTTPSGEQVTINWPIFASYTYDLTTLKVVREMVFSDAEALAEKYAAAGNG